MPTPPSAHPPAEEWWTIFDPRRSLRARAALVLGGSAILFTVLLGWIAGTVLQRHLERQLGGWFETLAFQVGDKIDRAIYERHRELQLTAGLAPFRTRGFAPDDQRKVLESLQDAAPDFAWIGVADASGRIVSATHGVFEGTSAEMRGWFRAGSDGAYTGPLHEMAEFARGSSEPDEEPSHRVLDLAVPLTADDGRFLGVLGAHVRWDWARGVQRSVVPDSAGRERIGVTIYAANGEVILDSGGSGWTQPPAAPANPNPRLARASLVENTSDGAAYLTGFARSHGFRDYRGLGWLTVVRQPFADAFAPVAELRRIVVACGLVLAGALMVATWRFAARLARRLRAIGIAAGRIREGDVLTTIPSSRGDAELEAMCTALGAMIDDFRAKQEKFGPTTAHTEPHLRSRAPASGEIHRVI